jgi:hypothetical protein
MKTNIDRKLSAFTIALAFSAAFLATSSAVAHAGDDCLKYEDYTAVRTCGGFFSSCNWQDVRPAAIQAAEQQCTSGGAVACRFESSVLEGSSNGQRGKKKARMTYRGCIKLAPTPSVPMPPAPATVCGTKTLRDLSDEESASLRLSLIRALPNEQDLNEPAGGLYNYPKIPSSSSASLQCSLMALKQGHDTTIAPRMLGTLRNAEKSFRGDELWIWIKHAEGASVVDGIVCTPAVDPSELTVRELAKALRGAIDLRYVDDCTDPRPAYLRHLHHALNYRILSTAGECPQGDALAESEIKQIVGGPSGLCDPRVPNCSLGSVNDYDYDQQRLDRKRQLWKLEWLLSQFNDVLYVEGVEHQAQWDEEVRANCPNATRIDRNQEYPPVRRL